jgi:hypothetical protein
MKYKINLTSWLTRAGAAILLLSAAACQNFSQPPPENKKAVSPTSARENKKMSEDFLNALKQHDRSVLEKARQAPPGLPRDIDQSVPALDAEARELSVELVTLQDNEYAGTFLLRRTADSDVNVATLAADNIGKIINKPKTEELLSAIPKRTDPFVRGKLYLEAGRRGENFVIEELRRQATNESDSDAKLQNLAARVKRGGQPEKAEFLEIVRKTEPDDALQIQELLLYIDDPSLAKGMIPWLDNQENVMRLGSDRQNMMAKMCDVAIWTAHLLKIKLPFETTHLRNYTPEEIAAARKVFELLPN